MGYEVDLNRAGSARVRRETGLVSTERVQGRDAAGHHFRFYELEPSIVIDVDITNTDATQIGRAKLRPMYSYAGVPEANLPWVWPLDANTKNYPLKNEVVVMVEYNGRMYYAQRINYFNHINQNVTKDPFKKSQTEESGPTELSATAAGNPNTVEEPEDENKVGRYFTINKKVQSLLPLEGDIIYEGRFGQSIRFGGTVERETPSVDQRFKGTWAIGEKLGSPIIIIRNGQLESGNQKTPYVEDINKDASSIYLTSDQIIPFVPSSKNQQSYRGSAPSIWDGAQILITSDRLVFNSKKNGMFFFSPTTFGFATGGTFNIDATNLFIVNSQRINLGLNASEPIIKGSVWLKIMLKLLVALQTETHPTPAGTSGFPANASVYSDLINELETALSSVSWTE